MQQDLEEGVLLVPPAHLVLTAAVTAVHHTVLPLVVQALDVPHRAVQVQEVLVPKVLPFRGAQVQKVPLILQEELVRKAPQTVIKGQVLSQAELQR